MITKLVDGDTVLVKHPTFTDGKWEKGQIFEYNNHYEIRLSNGHKTIVINETNIVYDVNIIKVDSNFNMGCINCKHCEKYDFEEPCHKCLGSYSYWEPCDSLKNKDKLIGNDIKTFSIDEGPFTDKKVNYSYISTNRCKTVNMLERQMHEQLLASPLKIEKLDMTSMYPDLKGGYKLDYSKNIPYHSDSIDALRYCIDDARVFAEFMADFNKKENKTMKKQQKRRDRNIIKVKDLETRKIKEIMFNGPATIIKWDPTWKQFSNDIVGDKTVTVCKEPDKLDKTTGFLLAVLKEVLTNQSYGNILEKIDEIRLEELKEDIEGIHKIGKEIVEEECKKVAEEDLIPDDKRVHKETIALLNEAAEAMNSAFHIGSRVKYIHGKLVYRVVDCEYIPTKHEMYYTLSAYKNDVLSGHETPKVYNVAHHRLKQVKRR